MLRNTFLVAISAITLAMTAVLFSLPTPQLKTDGGNHFVIRDVMVFDGSNVTGPTMLEVENGIFTRIDHRLDPQNLTTLDGSGKILLPGFIDAHTHNFGTSLNDALNFGVTTQIDMFTSAGMLAEQKAMRDSLAAKSSADLFSAGVLATAPGGHGTQFRIEVETLNGPAQANEWVKTRLAEGSDFIKLVYMPESDHFPSLDRSTAAAIIRAAHNQGVMAVAHISTQKSAIDMIEDGIDGLVHIFADEPVSERFLQLAVENQVFVIPTLSVLATINRIDIGRQLLNDPRTRPFLTAAQQQQLSADFGAADWPGFDFDVALSNTRLMHNAGILILAGSDAPNPGTAHGVSLHAEMTLLTDAGLTSLEAITAATSAPAQAFKIVDRGRIEPGMRADFILVDGDIEKDINASRSISAIYKNGHLISRTRRPESEPARQITSPLLSSFANSLAGPSNMQWAQTDDRMMNGQSVAKVELQDEVLKINTEVQSGFMFPWAGAGLFGEAQVSIADYHYLELQIRGTPGTYRAMVFSGSNTGAPPAQSFEVNQRWQTIRLPLADFQGMAAENFNGLAIVAGPAFGSFEYYLKNVKLD